MSEDMMNSMMGGDWLIILILFILLGGGGFGMNGFNRVGGLGYGLDGLGLKSNIATADDVYNATSQQSIYSKLNDLQHGISASAYENATLINNTGNSIVNALNCGFNGVTAQITALSNQLQQCCCEMKTQMLQDKYDATRAELLQAQGVIANTAQSRYIIDSLKATTAPTT